MINYATHREIYARRPGWLELERQAGKRVPCPGVYIVDDETERVWTAVCDACGDELGVPPREQRAYWATVTGASS